MSICPALQKNCFHYTEGYNESTEPIDAVNISLLARFEPITMTTPPSTTPDNDATNCATETPPKKDVQEPLILTTTEAIHVIYAIGSCRIVNPRRLFSVFFFIPFIENKIDEKKRGLLDNTQLKTMDTVDHEKETHNETTTAE